LIATWAKSKYTTFVKGCSDWSKSVSTWTKSDDQTKLASMSKKHSYTKFPSRCVWNTV